MGILQLGRNLKDLDATGCCPDPSDLEGWHDCCHCCKGEVTFPIILKQELVSAYLGYSADQVLKYEMPYYICIASF